MRPMPSTIRPMPRMVSSRAPVKYNGSCGPGTFVTTVLIIGLPPLAISNWLAVPVATAMRPRRLVVDRDAGDVHGGGRRLHIEERGVEPAQLLHVDPLFAAGAS